MGWVAGLAGLAGGIMSSQSSSRAARAAQYRPWQTGLQGVGDAIFRNGQLYVEGTPQYEQRQQHLGSLSDTSLDQFNSFRNNNLFDMGYLGNQANQADLSNQGSLFNLQRAASQPGYQNQNFMSGINNGLLGNFNPNQSAQDYTNLLRQQAAPQEQQAASSALTNLFNTGRLGTTGGANMFGQLAQAQGQADIGRQVAGQQHGLQQGLMAQQGFDQARMNQQGLMLNNFGANQQGLMNQFNIGQGMFGRNLDLYTNSYNATQDRFNRAMQMFGAENAMGSQYLSDYSNLLGSQQSQNQQLLDLGRIGASVGQAQTTANANAAQIRNQGNQDLIAGFLGAMNQWGQNRPPGK